MGKYLQDIRFVLDTDGESHADLKKQASQTTELIDQLFNFYLPRKIEIGNNIWRFISFLIQNKMLDGNNEEIGFVQFSYIYIDYSQLLALETFARKKMLLNLFTRGIESCCKIHHYPFALFREIEEKITSDGFVFDDFYKGKKLSPDKKNYAQMKCYLSETDKQVFIVVSDSKNETAKSFFVGDFNFKEFDRLKWVDNSTINIYQIDLMQSYRSKVAEDYFSVNIQTGVVIYQPVTRESSFEYGVKLLTETDQFDEALKFINQAAELGHGKASNILMNLKINPAQRNKAILLQTPKRK